MKRDVERAIEELRRGLPGREIRVLPDADGGAFVIADDMEIGEGFTPSRLWVGFHITFACPEADVYPHFIDPALRYIGKGSARNEHPDGNLPTAMSRGATMPGFELPAIQVSRRSNRRNAATDTPLQKLLRVVEFLRTR
jgi:hypothetical protein